MSDDILGKYKITELLAASWSDEMAQRFPNADHRGCRCEINEQGEIVRCVGWHCNRCGKSTNSYGHHDCPDRPERVIA